MGISEVLGFGVFGSYFNGAGIGCAGAVAAED